MTKVFKIGQILVYYDVPHVFTATDEVGTSFLCLLISIEESEEEENYNFISTAISKGRLIKFLNGGIELRDIFLNPETSQFYQFNNIDEIIVATSFAGDKIPEEYLPDEGFLLQNDLSQDQLIVSESIEYKNAVVHLAVSDQQDNYSIEADDLGDVIKLYQVFIENAYKKELHNRKAKNKKILYQPANYKLRAFASSHSSFNVHLYSTSHTDVFGQSVIEFGLAKFGKLLQEFNDENSYIDILRSIKGHSVSTFKRLIKKIIDDKLTLKHKWYALNQEVVHFSKISPERAIEIYEILNSSEELSEEIKNFTGYFSQVDADKGTWRLHENEENEVLNGESPKDKLLGIVVETQRYEITCIEVIHAMKVSEREKTHYILKDIKRS
jgi:hypothetical protein